MTREPDAIGPVGELSGAQLTDGLVPDDDRAPG